MKTEKKSKKSPPERLQHLFYELRVASEAITELVRGLVDLSDSIQIEQALRNNDGPYNELHKQIERTEGQFQDRARSWSATKPVQGSAAIDVEDSTGTDVGSEGFDSWTKSYLLTFGEQEGKFVWTEYRFR